jgi:hypothetical protein
MCEEKQLSELLKSQEYGSDCIVRSIIIDCHKDYYKHNHLNGSLTLYI